jgi:hypothetical protein
LGILGIENRKPKFFFSLFKPATTTKKIILFYFIFIFFERLRLRGRSPSVRTADCVRRGGGTGRDRRRRVRGEGPRGGGGMSASARTELVSTRMLGCVRVGRERGEREGGREGGSASARTPVRPCGHCRVRADASVLFSCNFITDATVRPSHGRPSGHRPTVRSSAILRVTTLVQGGLASGKAST